MKRSFVLAVSILTVLAVTGFTTPIYAETVDDCFADWEKSVVNKCGKKKGSKKEDCLGKVKKNFSTCLKSDKELKKKTRSKLLSCLDKGAPEEEDLVEQSKKEMAKTWNKFEKKVFKKCKSKLKIK